MLFSAKPKGFFVELSDHGCLFASTSSVSGGGLIIDAMEESPAGDADLLAQALDKLQPKKAPSGYVHAVCGLYPAKRVLRRATIDPKRTKEPTYFSEFMTQQFRIEADKYTMAVLHSVDGGDFDAQQSAHKEVLFCGLPSDDLLAIQDGLLGNGIYPERVELASVSVLGALVDYLAFKKSKVPTLVLEIGNDITHTFIVSAGGVEAARPIPQGLDSMIPVVQKELNLKDEESARKLFFSNTFDFTGMGPLLVKRLLKELQSSIGFYEVQTGQSVGQLFCSMLPSKLGWLDGTIANSLGVPALTIDVAAWLQSRGITLAPAAAANGTNPRWFGLYSLMANYREESSAPPAPNAVTPEKKG
ncbi:MAG: hypothetical protein RL324_151 [Verrucomicrobiota bacterium]|jgi:hypothetical protein